MYMLIRYPVGIIVEAVVLAKGRNRLRVVQAGFPDAIELRRSGSQWFTETCQRVEFDFVMSNAHRDGAGAYENRPAAKVGAASA